MSVLCKTCENMIFLKKFWKYFMLRWQMNTVLNINSVYYYYIPGSNIFWGCGLNHTSLDARLYEYIYRKMSWEKPWMVFV